MRYGKSREHVLPLGVRSLQRVLRNGTMIYPLLCKKPSNRRMLNYPKFHAQMSSSQNPERSIPLRENHHYDHGNELEDS